MQPIRTRFFGLAECSPDDIIVFPAGIPPFIASTRFVLMSDDKKRPLAFLQSVDDETLCFITIPIRVLDASYPLAIEEDDLQLLDWKQDRPPSLDDLSCFAILTIPESGPASANLLAPVLIDTAKRLGVQAVRADNLYLHAQSLDQLIHAGDAVC
jgi:flagellar assembly factor FliW